MCCDYPPVHFTGCRGHKCTFNVPKLTPFQQRMCAVGPRKLWQSTLLSENKSARPNPLAFCLTAAVAGGRSGEHTSCSKPLCPAQRILGQGLPPAAYETREIQWGALHFITRESARSPLHMRTRESGSTNQSWLS